MNNIYKKSLIALAIAMGIYTVTITALSIYFLITQTP